MSGDPAQEYFSDGLSDELISSLGRIAEMRVVGRTSTFSFKGKSVTIGDIARALNVGAVLEGSLRRSGGRIRITTELVDATTGFGLWVKSYDRGEGDILSLQQDIADSVTRALQIHLAPDDVAKLTPGGTRNPKAFDAYLRGMRFSNGLDNTAMKAALAAFEEAISIDHGFARAHTARGWALMTLSLQQETPTLLPEALSEAECAIALAPTLAWAHVVRGQVLIYRLNFQLAKSELDRAIELAPGDSKVASAVAEAALGMSPGNDANAQIASLQRGVQLNPLSPSAYFYLALAFYEFKRDDDALITMRHMQQLQPYNNTISNQLLGLIELARGHADAALQICSAGRDFMEHYCLARAYHSLNMPNEAAKELIKVHDEVGDRAASSYADAYASWGQKAEAVRWLKIAYLQNPADLVDMRADPDLETIVDTPEYRDIIGKMNFPS